MEFCIRFRQQRSIAPPGVVTPDNDLEAICASRTVARMMDGSIRQEFNRNGYIIARGVLPVGLVADVLEECRDIMRLQIQRHGISGTANKGVDFDAALAGLFRASMQSYLAAAKLTQYLPSLHRIGVEGPLLDLVRTLGIDRPVISTRPVVHIVSDDLVVPDGYHRTPPHQDWRSVQGSLDGLVAWAPLVPVEPGQNALEVVPGSHKEGLLPTAPHAFGSEVSPDRLDDAAFVPIAAGPGDVVVFSMFLVHRTGAAGDAGVRWAASYRYNNLDEPSFIDRDFPNPYIYRPQEDLLYEGFPTPADIRRVFDDD